jgi:hypothetical protein
MPTAVITGTSKRFGWVFFEVLLERGWTGFPVVRDPAYADDLMATPWTSGDPVFADVTSADAEPDIQGSEGSHEVSRPPRQQGPEP